MLHTIPYNTYIELKSFVLSCLNAEKTMCKYIDSVSVKYEPTEDTFYFNDVYSCKAVCEIIPCYRVAYSN